ncbi:hypothetical protein ACCT09_44125, partial [Rhizobium ruizarguesonis]
FVSNTIIGRKWGIVTAMEIPARARAVSGWEKGRFGSGGMAFFRNALLRFPYDHSKRSPRLR